MRAIGNVLYIALNLYMYVIIANVIMSWLLAFNVVNYGNQFVRTLDDILRKLTEPVLAPIRRFMPNLGGIDISPIVVFLLIILLQGWIYDYMIRG